MLKLLSDFRSSYFIGVILLSVPVFADSPKPSQEFWEYMAEYGDDNGNVLDPLEYDQILSLKDNDLEQNEDTNSTKEKASIDKPKIRNTDMKFEQKSSVQNSSTGVKGERL
jgi:hypothetical protein